jgi:hypothetical protein
MIGSGSVSGSQSKSGIAYSWQTGDDTESDCDSDCDSDTVLPGDTYFFFYYDI